MISTTIQIVFIANQKAEGTTEYPTWAAMADDIQKYQDGSVQHAAHVREVIDVRLLARTIHGG